MSLSRRDVLRALASVGVVGCPAPPPEAPPEEEPPPPDDAPKKPPGPRVLLADGPTARHVLLADSIGPMSGGAGLTVYADGLAIYRDSQDWNRNRPPVLLLRIGADELQALQTMLAAPGFVDAASSYATRMKDGGALRLAVGDRRIAIHGMARSLPPELAAVHKAVLELRQRVEDLGQDAFIAAEPRLLALYRRSFLSAGTADQLMVWANGVLDYRITASDTPDVAGQDRPHPIVRLEQVPRADVAELATLLAGDVFLSAASTHEGDEFDATAGTGRYLLHAGPTIATVGTAFEPSAGQRPVFAALTGLLARFDAAPDEATVMKPPRGSAAP